MAAASLDAGRVWFNNFDGGLGSADLLDGVGDCWSQSHAQPFVGKPVVRLDYDSVAVSVGRGGFDPFVEDGGGHLESELVLDHLPFDSVKWWLERRRRTSVS